ncbi:inositol monophosphatase family protein [Nocardioides sp. SYSU D00065]|uniref:inositol monophosphatase family protein n=1 Tax=Nocardioides sp. SYSU D00065 TaxID=2817378 RepID=UPI0027DDA5B4|nr:inositol monophosphatase family protein [Nocardioides sp. SYSU D00065]
MTRPADPAELRDVALTVAREAAALARRMREEGVDVADTKSSDTDVVTRADRAVEDLLRRRLLELRPDDAILGEEGDDHAGTSGVRWVVDPIDGTVNYLYGIRDCAVSVAAEQGGEPVAGAVVGIGVDVEYVAALGHGATRDGRPIRVRPSPPLAQRLVMTGFGYRPEVRTHQARCLAALLPVVRDIRRIGTSSLDICHVADGSADAYVEEGPHPWDYSAAAVVLREAGGRFGVLPGTLDLDDWPHDGVVVATPADGWDAFVEALRTARFLA